MHKGVDEEKSDKYIEMISLSLKETVQLPSSPRMHDIPFFRQAYQGALGQTAAVATHSLRT